MTSCVVCNRNSTTHLCETHHARLAQNLTQIADLYALCPDFLEPGIEPQYTSSMISSRRGRTHNPDEGRNARADFAYAASPAGADLTVCALTDRRGTDSTLALLWTWGRLVRDERQLDTPETGTVTGEVAFLHAHLDWISRHEWVEDLDHEVGRQLRALERATHRAEVPFNLGDCPVATPDGTCGGRLRASADRRSVACPRCGATWDGEHLAHLGVMLREEEDAA